MALLWRRGEADTALLPAAGLALQGAVDLGVELAAGGVREDVGILGEVEDAREEAD